jgi:hypothetical protein
MPLIGIYGHIGRWCEWVSNKVRNILRAQRSEPRKKALVFIRNVVTHGAAESSRPSHRVLFKGMIWPAPVCPRPGASPSSAHQTSDFR